MSDETIKRLMAMQKETPSLSERVGDALTVLCGEPVQFYGLIMLPRSDGEFAVMTVGRLESEGAERLPGVFMQAMERLATGREMRVQIRQEPGLGEKH